jgi:hypothetical protein
MKTGIRRLQYLLRVNIQGLCKATRIWNLKSCESFKKLLQRVINTETMWISRTCLSKLLNLEIAMTWRWRNVYFGKLWTELSRRPRVNGEKEKLLIFSSANLSDRRGETKWMSNYLYSSLHRLTQHFSYTKLHCLTNTPTCFGPVLVEFLLNA